MKLVLLVSFKSVNQPRFLGAKKPRVGYSGMWSPHLLGVDGDCSSQPWEPHPETLQELLETVLCIQLFYILFKLFCYEIVFNHIPLTFLKQQGKLENSRQVMISLLFLSAPKLFS